MESIGLEISILLFCIILILYMTKPYEKSFGNYIDESNCLITKLGLKLIRPSIQDWFLFKIVKIEINKNLYRYVGIAGKWFEI